MPEGRAQPALFINASAAIAHSRLRQACMRVRGMQAGGLAAQSVAVLFTRCTRQSNGSPVRLPPSRLHAPVSPCDWAISQRTVMNNAG